MALSTAPRLDAHLVEPVCRTLKGLITQLVRTIGVFASIFCAGPSIAGSVDTPWCHGDLAEADRLIHGVRVRENSVQQGDWQGLSRLLQRDLRDMSRARQLMYPCLTSHDHGENIGQMDASIADIQCVLDARCN
jgi:hypothetical protein